MRASPDMVINFRTQIALRYADFGEMPCVYDARAMV